MEISAYTLIVFVLLALVAEIIGTVGGFGSSVFFVPLAAVFFDFHSVLGITAIFHLSSNLSKIYFFRRGFDRKLLIRMGIPAVLLVLVGAWLSKFIEARQAGFWLSLFLILLALVLLIFQRATLQATTRNAILGGAGSGFAAGLLGTGGAIRGLTMAAFNLEKEVFIATSAIIDLAIDASRTTVYATNGFVHAHDLYIIPFLLVVGFLGTWIGKIILKRLKQQLFRNLSLGMIFLIGVYMLTRFCLQA